MRIDIEEPESAEEFELRRSEEAETLSERHGLPLEVAQRIIEMAKSIDQAHAIAELMR